MPPALDAALLLATELALLDETEELLTVDELALDELALDELDLDELETLDLLLLAKLDELATLDEVLIELAELVGNAELLDELSVDSPPQAANSDDMIMSERTLRIAPLHL